LEREEFPLLFIASAPLLSERCLEREKIAHKTFFPEKNFLL
jgi:hypothetical protein